MAGDGRFLQSPGDGNPHFRRGRNVLFQAEQMPGNLPGFFLHLGDLFAGAGQHLDHQGAGEDAVLAEDVAAHGQTAAGFTAQQGIMFDHAGSDVLETNRHFVTLFAKFGCHPVEHVGGRQVADHTAALAAHFMQIPVHQQEQVVGGNVAAFFVNDGDAVGVAIGGQAQVEVAFFQVGDQQPQGFQVRSRGTAAKKRVAAFVDEGHPAARLGQDDAQASTGPHHTLGPQ